MVNYRMIINDSQKFIFVHIPKNSGTEMGNSLLKEYNDSILLIGGDTSTNYDMMHLYVNIQSIYIPEIKLNDYFKFCITRNPYNKVISAYYNIKDRFPFENINEFIINKLCVEFIFSSHLHEASVHFRPQHTFIFRDDGELDVQHILRYEFLNQDISEMNSKYNMKVPLYGNPQKYQESKYKTLLSPESIKKINILYEKDFELLNYVKN